MAWEIREFMTPKEFIYWVAYFDIKADREKKAIKEMETHNKTNNNNHRRRLEDRARKSLGN